MQLYLLVILLVIVVVNVIVVKFIVPPPVNEDMGYRPPITMRNVRVPIVTGLIPLSAQTRFKRSTYNSLAPDFLEMPVCTDPQKGGFSYTFWMNVRTASDTASSDSADIPIVLRGNEDTVSFDGKMVNMSQGPKISITIKDRKIGAVVNANTVNNPDFEKRFESAELQRLTAIDWVMLTFVFKENKVVIGSTRNSIGFQIDMYLNNRIVDSVDVTDDALIPNQGDVFVLPNIKSSTGSMSHSRLQHLTGHLSDVSYHNFALSGVDVDMLFASGFSRKAFQPIKKNDIFLRTKEYNVVALQNEVNMLQPSAFARA